MFSFDTEGSNWMKSRLIYIVSGVFLLVLLLPFFLPSAIYKNLIESKLESRTGLEFNFVGDYDFSLIPSISFNASNVEFNGNIASGVDVIGVIDNVVFDMNFWDLIIGDFIINELQLISPKITLDGDFTKDLPLLVHQALRTTKKSDIRYLEMMVSLLDNTYFNFSEIIDGTLVWNKDETTRLSLQKLRLYSEKPEGGGDFIVDGDAFLNDRAVDLSARLESPDEFLRGYRSSLTILVDSSPFKFEFDGSAAHRYAFVAQGNLHMEVPSLYEYCRWLNDPEICVERSESLDVNATMNLRDQRLQIETAEIALNTNIISAEGVVEFVHAKPEIVGTIKMPAQSFSDFKDNATGFLDVDFENLLLDTFDAKLNVHFNQINMPTGDILSPEIGVLLNDGRLAISTERLDFLGSLTNARLRWHKGIDNGYMDLRFNTTGLDIKKLQTLFNLNYQLAGSLKTSFEIQSLGSKLRDMMKTARIYGEFSLFDGGFENQHVIQALSGSSGNMLPFAEIKGRIKGDRGQVTSQDIEIDIAHTDVSGAASFDFINDIVKIQLNSQVPNADNPGETLDGFVDVAGKIGQLRLRTSLGTELEETIPQDGLHSGLIPNTPSASVEENISDDQEFILNESDLLD